MKLFAALVILTFSWNSMAAYGTLGREQCPFDISSFATSLADSLHASGAQLQLLESNRTTLEAEMSVTSGELTTYQNYLKAYFGSPWVEAMQAHMDNGADCCESRVVAMNHSSDSKSSSFTNERFPAEITSAPGGAQVATGSPNNPEVAPVGASCFGYPGSYCTSSWSRTTPRPRKTDAPACLQSGFALTPAWDRAACLHGGEIDPQVCTDARINKNPADHKNCVLVLNAYREASLQKRQKAASLSSINIQINGIKFPGRPSSEITSGNNNLMDNLGAVMGVVVRAAVPLITQYLAFPGEREQRFRSPNSARPLYRHPATSRNASGPPAGAVYFGPSYGYGFQHEGQYGGQPPGFQTGGFACSQGLLGAGVDLVTQLLGNNKLNFNGPLGAIFGSNGGNIPSMITNFLFGDNQSGRTPRGFSPPYQRGGVNGVQPGPPAGAVKVSDYPQYLSGRTPYPSNSGRAPVGATTFISGNGNELSGPSNNSLILGNPGENSGYLSGGYQQIPYFGNMGNMLSSLFNGNFNVNAQAQYNSGN